MGPMEAPPTGAAMFPWESSVTGRETVPGQSRFQHHITGTVAFSLAKAAALGLVPESDAQEVRQAAAQFYRARSIQSARGLEIRGTMSPDEHHVGDNDLYTNMLAQWCVAGGSWNRSSEPRFALPSDEKSLLTYDDDGLRGYKQAAAVLAIYPLQHPEAESQARAMMERFADQVTENGPAMSDSVHALIWARLGERERAYEAWRASWRDFAMAPHLLFSEKRRKEVTYFTTGAGGSLQAVLFGFLGIRLDYEEDPTASWSKRLVGEHWLTVTPNLPPAWKSVKLENFDLLGRPYTLSATHDGITVSQGG
jgi:trehalose/maltose hydrolase-like predicted phosphorylase